MSQGNKRYSNSTKRGEKLESSIPNDLIIDIFSRLPGNSIARFCCLSKLWSSMLHRSYFTELFLTRSSARPRLLFIVKAVDKPAWSIYSAPQPQNPYGNRSARVVAADFHMKFHGYLVRPCSYTSGLVSLQIAKERRHDTMHVICNPITGRYATVPQTFKYGGSSLGFDPIGKRFKVLAEGCSYPHGTGASHGVLTLESEIMSWRSEIDSSSHHKFLYEGICINGVCYILVERFTNVPLKLLLCFDVRSEKFKFIGADCFRFRDQHNVIIDIKLINYKGRLGGINWNYRGTSLELCMCILEDVEKQEWSKRVYSFGENIGVDPSNCIIVGMTTNGEIILSMKSVNDDEPFYVYYFNPERNPFQSVEIEGIDKSCRLYAFVDHVEDLNVNHAKELKPKRKWPARQGLNINRKRPTSVPPMKNKQPTILMKNKDKRRSWKATQLHV